MVQIMQTKLDIEKNKLLFEMKRDYQKIKMIIDLHLDKQQ